MNSWRRNDGGFSRVWRRGRAYSLSQLRHLARRERASIVVRGDRCAVMDLRTGRQLASFAMDADPAPASRQNENLRAQAVLRL